MSISTYAELQTAVADWLHRSNLTSSIPNLITLGEGRVYRNVRVRQMEAQLSGNTAAGILAVPSDYVALKEVHTGSPVSSIKRKSVEWLYENNPSQTAGIPKYIARERNGFIFRPIPADGTAILGTYYKRLVPISTTLNSIFTAAPGLWLFAALIESASFLKNDARLMLWESKFGQIVKEVNAEEYLENDSGSTLAMTAQMTHP